MSSKFLSFKLFIFNQDINPIPNERIREVINKLPDFLPQKQQKVEVEFNNNEFAQRVVDSFLLYSLDRKWVIDIQKQEIRIIYNHAYPEDKYSLKEFRDSACKYLSTINEIFGYQNYSRLGFIIESISNDASFIDNENIEDNLIEKTSRLVNRQNFNSISEEVNIVKETTYSKDLKIRVVQLDKVNVIPLANLEFTKIFDFNTQVELTDNRFSLNKTKEFLEEIETKSQT